MLAYSLNLYKGQFRRDLSRSISGAILHIFCVAAYGAHLIFIAFLPLVSPGVIIVSPLRGSVKCYFLPIYANLVINNFNP
jgi:hypothetical protein